MLTLVAAEYGHFDMVRWLCENTDEDDDEDGMTVYDQVVEHALVFGDDDLVRFLLPPGRCVLDYAENCPQVEVIEMMLDCGYLRRDAKSAMGAIANLAGGGHLDLMQQIALLYSPLPEDCSKWESSSNCWISSWFKALRKACKFGDLESVQWLVQYPIRIRTRELIKKKEISDVLTCGAAEEGHWKIVQYLCEQKITENLDLPPDRAIRNGRLKCVEVLIQQFLLTKKRPMYCLIDVAAGYGRLEIVQFLHNFNPRNIPHKESTACDAWWYQSRKAVYLAAGSGNLELAKWLHANRSDNGTNAIDAAVRSGHLDVVKWLHVNRTESCTKYVQQLTDICQWRNGSTPIDPKGVYTIRWIGQQGRAI